MAGSRPIWQTMPVAIREKTIVTSLPRTTQIGPPNGLWWKCTSLGQPLYIHKRFHKDVEKADSLRPTA
jgi:hypothetical protein